MDEVYWDYPTTLRDEEGYPTPAALDYIRNWSFQQEKTGKNFGKGMYGELIEYIKTIWTYDNAIVYEGGLLEIHTLGWSGNEDIIDELKHTDLWLLKFRCKQTGGHYYFKVTDESQMDWVVTKEKR